MEQENNSLEILTCYKHPNHQTLLRCNQCLRPICLDCAISTPTGYRCKECVEKQQRNFITTVKRDYLVAALVSGGLGFLGSILQSNLFLSSVLISVLIGIGVGTLDVNVVRFLTGKRRSPLLHKVIQYAAAFGAALPWLRQAINIFRSLFLGQYQALLAGASSLQWSILYIISMCGAVWANLQGYSFRK